MNRLNKYTHLLQAEDMHFIYDISTENAIALNPQLFHLIETHIHDIDALKAIHTELYDGLLSCGMIVDDQTDDAQVLIEKFKAIDSDPAVFDIIINPTLDCNLRCWYCYEKHGSGTMMNPEVIQSVKFLIDNKLQDDRLKRMTISFFGGEPLLGWDKVVVPILQYAVEKCKEANVSLSSSFTTNGVLLNESKFNTLSELGLGNTSFQITVDGNKLIHDESRVGINKVPTYDIIMKNVRSGLEKGFPITLRFNYTPDNLASFLDVLSELDHLSEDAKKYVNCSFQQIWQTQDSHYDDNVMEYIDVFKKLGVNASCNTTYRRHLCYADRENQVTINYNGDLYKCTAREFDGNMKEGVLEANGKLSFNDRYHQRMEHKYDNIACRNCEILPLCNGRCSQGKLENPNSVSCRMNYDKSTKRSIILGSLFRVAFNRILPLNELQTNNT